MNNNTADTILQENTINLFKKDIFFSLSKLNKKNDPHNNYSYAIASAFFKYSKEPNFEINLKLTQNFDIKANLSNLQNFKIISVIYPQILKSNKIINFDYNLLGKDLSFSYNNNISYLIINLEGFFYITRNLYDNLQKNNIIFHFKGFNWYDILIIFKVHDIIISGGSNTFKHILSPVSTRLALFLFAYYEDFETQIKDSFYLAKAKEFSKPLKDFTSKKIEEELSLLTKLKKEKEEKELNAFKTW